GLTIVVLFLFFSLDDLFWDLLYYLWGRKRVGSRLRLSDLDSVPARLLAVLIPAWNEARVIGPMLENLMSSVNYPLSLFHVFVGVYPNDEETQREVKRLEGLYPNIHAVVNSKEGPTSKAQNLNQVFRFIRRFEEEKRCRFACYVIFDAEDVVHPTLLKLANYLAFQHGVIQLPVFPLQFYPTWKNFFKYLTSSTYADEFAENHYRGLLAREAAQAFVPSAGTGFVIARSVLDRVGWQDLFDERSLTEDYKLSLHFAQLGIPTHFFLEGVERVLDDGRVVVEYIAIREIFPNTLREAVRQKSRWIYGISFQSFSLRDVLRNRSLPPMAKYSLYRDWKAKYANLLPFLGYIAFVYFLLSLFVPLPPMYPRGTPSFWLSVFLTFLMVERQVMRAAALKSVYGWRSAFFGCFVPPLLPLRMVWGNIVNFLAAVRAWRVALFGFPKNRPRWQKTDHSYPLPQVLARYRRRLGDLLLEKGVVDPKTLYTVLQEKDDKPLGEKLVEKGVVTERDLLASLGELLRSSLLEIRDFSLPQGMVEERLLEICRRLGVFPVACGKTFLILASSRPLSQGVIEEIQARLGKRKVFMVLAPFSAIARGLDALEKPLLLRSLRLGEKLVERGLIEEGHLVEALRVQAIEKRPLGEILCTMGVILPEDLEKVLKEEE
ncbi:MAG: glycosyltransferase, partial [Atribacterota bacterium]